MTPERSLVQRMDALQKANAVRTHRRVLKVAIARGEVDPSEVLLNAADDPFLGTMELRLLLLAVPGLGPERVRVYLHRARIAPRRTVGALTSREVGALLVELRQHRVRSPKRYALAMRAAA